MFFSLDDPRGSDRPRYLHGLPTQLAVVWLLSALIATGLHALGMSPGVAFALPFATIVTLLPAMFIGIAVREGLDLR